jgi:hypothetical protein
MRLGLWLMTLVEPLLAKVLLGLGFSVVSIVGMDAVLTAMKNSFVVSMNTMPADWLQFALYLWIGKGLGIIFGACTTKLMLWTVQSATSLLGKSA